VRSARLHTPDQRHNSAAPGHLTPPNGRARQTVVVGLAVGALAAYSLGDLAKRAGRGMRAATAAAVRGGTVGGMNLEIVQQEGYTSAFVEEAPVRELFPGIRLRPLWKGPTGAHANVLEMDPGTSWPRRDVHEPGPEEVYVVNGTFNDGARD
jgi:hypothetical protein